MRFRWYVSVAWLMILLILSVASMGNTVYAQIGPGDSVCVENEVEITPYSLNGWEVSNDYNGTFNSSYMFTPDGLEITNPENLARTRAMKVVNKPLSEIDSLGYVRTGAASYQLEATGWTDGQTFATLVWEEIYNPSTGVYDGYWWRTGSALGVPNGVNSPTPYETRHQVTLPMILAANPSLQILRYGVSLGSYQPGTSVIESIEFDCETSTFVAEPLACDEITGPTVATFENRMGWDLDTDTRSAGEYEFVAPEGSLPGGLLIHTTNSPATSQDKVAGYLPVNVHLKDIGSTADLLLEYHPIDGYPSTPPPGLQIKIDLDNNGTFDGYMAYEPTYYPDIWWSNSINTTTFPGLPAGGGGYPVGGPLYEVLDAYPDAHILAIGFSLGSGVFGGGIIETMTIACHEYRFAPDEVEPDAPTFNDPTCDNQAASITFPESEIFQYQVTGSTMPGGSVQVTASLKPGVKNKVATGTLVWNHTFATIDSLNCPVAVTPEEPMVDSIETCGEEGSVTFATTEGVTYSRQPLNNVEGLVTVSATANDGYVLQDYDGPWSYDLGDFEECVTPPTEVTPVEPTVDFIDTCGETGSVTLAVTEGITYTASPENATEGAVQVSATAQSGYVLVGYTGPWVYDLGDFEECVVPPTEVVAKEPTYVEATCSDQTPEVVIPVSEVVTYTVVGSLTPGGSVQTTADLYDHITNTVLISDTSWVHQFSQLLNCETPLIEVEPVEPEVNPILACGQYGSIELAETVGVTYTMVPTDAVQGAVLVTALAEEGYVLVNNDSPWVYDLGDFTDCAIPPTEVTAPAPGFVNPTCENRKASVVIPGSEVVQYIVEGSPAPGQTVFVLARLLSGQDNTILVGDEYWVHEFPSIASLSCPLVELYLPVTRK